MHRKTRRNLNRMYWKIHTPLCNTIAVSVILGMGYVSFIMFGGWDVSLHYGIIIWTVQQSSLGFTH